MVPASRITLGSRAVILLALALLATALASHGTAGAQGHSAVRSLSAAWVEPGGRLEVTVSAEGYGSIGQVVETMPEGFVYQGSDMSEAAVSVEGRTIAFTLFQSSSFTYVVTAPAEEGRYAFTGTVKDQTRQERPVTGASTVRVGPQPTPEPTVAPTPVPATTSTPEPTATPGTNTGTNIDANADLCARGNAHTRADGSAGTQAHRLAFGGNVHTRADSNPGGVVHSHIRDRRHSYADAAAHGHPTADGNADAGADVAGGPGNRPFRRQPDSAASPGTLRLDGRPADVGHRGHRGWRGGPVRRRAGRDLRPRPPPPRGPLAVQPLVGRRLLQPDIPHATRPPMRTGAVERSVCRPYTPGTAQRLPYP